jgi:putative ABC transport system permease protein
MMLETIWQDARFATRSYAKAPAFTFAILATLALGIGTSTAIFSMVNGILLQPLPLANPDTLVYANEVNRSGALISISWPNYLDWRARAQSFDALALSREEQQTLTGIDRAERIRARRVTGNFFRVLRVQPARGRTFEETDDRPAADAKAVVTDAFWRSQLGSDPAIVGRVLTLNQTPYTVVGVLPAGFQYLRPHDVFLSMGPVAGSRVLLDRGNHNGFNAVGRLRPGVSVQAADQELRRIAADLEREYPDTNTTIGVKAEPLAGRLVADVRLALLALFGAVAFLLVIACVNVANLLVARGAAREHELAVRAALGGSRMRLAGQLIVESTVVSAAGCLLGIAIASGLLRALIAVAPENTPRLAEVRLDMPALLFAVAAAAIAGTVFGAFPAFHAAGVHGQQALIRGRAAGFSGRSHRLRRGLIAVETSLALLLLTGAGLMVRTLQQLTHVDIGFKPDHLLTARFNLPGTQWTDDRQRAFYGELLSRLGALPGVTHTALALSLPIDGSQWNSIFTVADQPTPSRIELPSAAFSPVSAGYFETLGIRLVAGRPFDDGDRSASTPVAIVNESLARRLWPGENPIGKRLKQGWPETPVTIAPWREVVGVAADVKFNGVMLETPLQVYLPLPQEPSRGLAIVARTVNDPAALTSQVNDTVRRIDRDVPLYAARTMDQILAASIAQQRMSMVIFSVFAFLALVLASVGLYGVVAHGVTERTHEIGVRMALGADRPHVIGLVVWQGLSMAIVGAAVGLVAAYGLSRWIEGLLFGISATDGRTFAAGVVTLLIVAAIACTLPAWRATHVDPTQALRAE